MVSNSTIQVLCVVPLKKIMPTLRKFRARKLGLGGVLSLERVRCRSAALPPVYSVPKNTLH